VSNIEKRVERLEDKVNPIISPEEQRHLEELGRRIERGRERVLADNPNRQVFPRPEISDIPPLPNGRVDIGAILERSVAWYRACLEKQQKQTPDMG